MFIACSKKENKKAGQSGSTNIEQIRSVEVVNFGGGLSVYSSTLINQDSLYYQHRMATVESHDIKFSRKINPEDWRNIVAKINLNTFRKVKEGKTMQPVDGIDTKIVIISNKDTISKMNGYDQYVWKNILDEVSRYDKE